MNELEKAQIKLSDTISAINREELVLESKKSELSDISKKIKEINDELMVLEQNCSEEKQSLKLLKENYKENKDKLSKENKAL